VPGAFSVGVQALPPEVFFVGLRVTTRPQHHVQEGDATRLQGAQNLAVPPIFREVLEVLATRHGVPPTVTGHNVLQAQMPPRRDQRILVLPGDLLHWSLLLRHHEEQGAALRAPGHRLLQQRGPVRLVLCLKFAYIWRAFVKLARQNFYMSIKIPW